MERFATHGLSEETLKTVLETIGATNTETSMPANALWLYNVNSHRYYDYITSSSNRPPRVFVKLKPDAVILKIMTHQDVRDLLPLSSSIGKQKINYEGLRKLCDVLYVNESLHNLEIFQGWNKYATHLVLNPVVMLNES